MARAYVKAQQLDPSRTSDGKDVRVRATRDGALYQAPWLQALVLEGRVYGVSYGSANIGIATIGTFGAGAIDLEEHDLLQTVPATVGILPVYFKVAYVGLGTGAVGTALAWGASAVISGGISCTPYNLRPASSNVSACTVAGLGNAGGTAFVVAGVIYHEATTGLTGVAATPAQLGHEWSAHKASFLPVIEGLVSPTRQVAGFAAAVGGTGYINYQWVELPIAALE